MKYWFKLSFALLLFVPFFILALYFNGPVSSFQAKAEDRWTYIVIHHSGSNAANLKSIDEYHVHKGWDGIGYHFIIGNGINTEDGKVEETFRFKELKDGAHALTPDLFYNKNAIGICLIGDFNVAEPTIKQLASLKNLLRTLKKEFNIVNENILFHKEVKPTECPGKNVPIENIRLWLEETSINN
jgi:hypothetical protein